MKELAQQECAKYDEGYCLPQDVCCEAVCEDKICPYLARAVLPLDKELEALVNGGKGLLRDPALKKCCACCGGTLIRENNRQIYCSSCARTQRHVKERLRKRDARRKKKMQSAFRTEDNADLDG